MRRTGNRSFAGPVQMISVNGALSPTRTSTVVIAEAISRHVVRVLTSNAFVRIQAASRLRMPSVACRMDSRVGLPSELATCVTTCCQTSPDILLRATFKAATNSRDTITTSARLSDFEEVHCFGGERTHERRAIEKAVSSFARGQRQRQA